jgi:hypothetical protein
MDKWREIPRRSSARKESKKTIMNDKMNIDLTPGDVEILDGLDSIPGIIAVLGELKPGAILTEEGMAALFGRHPASVKRAVQRGELPPPTRLFGSNAWTVRVLIRHIEDRLDQAARDAQKTQERITRLEP